MGKSEGGKLQEVTNFPLLTKEGTDPRRPSEVWLGQSIQHIEPSSSRQIHNRTLVSPKPTELNVVNNHQ